jgi:hypothetical protein
MLQRQQQPRLQTQQQQRLQQLLVSKLTPH